MVCLKILVMLQPAKNLCLIIIADQFILNNTRLFCLNPGGT